MSSFSNIYILGGGGGNLISLLKFSITSVNGAVRLFSEPISGAMDKGAVGALTGFGKGLGILLLAPVKGGVAFLQRLGEGARNTPGFLFGDEDESTEHQDNDSPRSISAKSDTIAIATQQNILEMENRQRRSSEKGYSSDSELNVHERHNGNRQESSTFIRSSEVIRPASTSTKQTGGHIPKKDDIRGIRDGIKRGTLSMGQGLYNGVTGVFMEPYRSVKSGGNVVKGVGRGLAGVVFSPIAGVCDFVTHSAEGIRVHVKKEFSGEKSSSRDFFKRKSKKTRKQSIESGEQIPEISQDSHHVVHPEENQQWEGKSTQSDKSIEKCENYNSAEEKQSKRTWFRIPFRDSSESENEEDGIDATSEDSETHWDVSPTRVDEIMNKFWTIQQQKNPELNVDVLKEELELV